MNTEIFNPIGWFEIPAIDMERAVKFYETVFGYTLKRHKMGELDMAWFPSYEERRGAAGSLVKNDWYTPAGNGVLIYFTAPSGNLENELARVLEAGGQIIVPRQEISEEYGFMAVILDTEGNRVALHSKK